MQIEDQSCPKIYGHVNGNQVISDEKMIAKIKAVVDAIQDENTIIFRYKLKTNINGMSQGKL
ncbi:hypothetical protein [Clostridium luticellarii]|uniref:Carboxyvinyl-carboxyphosphonate phosphorylmutase n=1 Tax=Clostridium luticellarii TaxID=1691940 RepID=A0A2T0BM54_9CLOT|nr:hypothetical protein [Clostridium luticellarii]PRR84966.1 Carboxyvinyl-carboxyphosphonate phosphorylmutase [Clostridium luticellarii]